MAASQSHLARLVTSPSSTHCHPPIVSCAMADGPVFYAVVPLESGHKSCEYLMGTELARGILPASTLLNRFSVYLSTAIPPTGSRTANSTLAELECL